jgi:small-conductance mechanosensitive channel
VKVSRETVHVVNNFFKIIIVGIASIAILGSLKIDVTGLIASVGIVALAVGFAAQTIISNLISGLFLIFERVFTIGDIIQVETVMGKVVRTSFRTTQIETIDGNIVTIPNAILASSQLTNMTSGTNETTIILEEDIDIYADYQKAKTLMLHAAENTPGVIIDEAHVPFVVIDRIASQWRLNLKLFVTVHASNWYRIQSNLTERIKHHLDASGILPPVTALARSRLSDIQEEAQHLDD